MLRVGLTQRVEVPDDRDERRDCLDQGWASLLLENGLLPIPLPNRPEDVATLVRELNLDGVILTGGNDLAHLPEASNPAAQRDEFEGKLLDICAEHTIPVLGVCRGLQMMVVHYDGTLAPVSGHVATTHGIVIHSCDAMPLCRPDPVGSAEPAGSAVRTNPVESVGSAVRTNPVVVNSYHNFGVYPEGLGPYLQAVATAPDGSVEAVAHKHGPQWAIMWHPERPPHNPRDGKLLRTLFRQPAVGLTPRVLSEFTR